MRDYLHTVSVSVKPTLALSSYIYMMLLKEMFHKVLSLFQPSNSLLNRIFVYNKPSSMKPVPLHQISIAIHLIGPCWTPLCVRGLVPQFLWRSKYPRINQMIFLHKDSTENFPVCPPQKQGWKERHSWWDSLQIAFYQTLLSPRYFSRYYWQ